MNESSVVDTHVVDSHVVDSHAAESLLFLNLSPALELDLIDWLLLRPEVDGFTSIHGYGHGSAHALSNIAEQVTGKARRVQIQVILSEEQWPGLLAALQQEFAGSDLFYWVSPVLCSGALSAG